MQLFNLVSPFKPSGDQPQAIEKLVGGLKGGRQFQTLLGVTGSGKTFTMANVIQAVQKPTLIISHNKTLAAQLADEFQEFFPDNAVHYFVSYYDYYQPEAYMPQTDTYIEKETQINEEIDRLRHSATQNLLTRKDVIIVASVSCIYGLGDPNEYLKQHVILSVGDALTMRQLGLALVSLRFNRNDMDQKRGTFRIVANHLDIVPSMATNEAIRITFGTKMIDSIHVYDRLTGATIRKESRVEIFPATHYVASQEHLQKILVQIEKDLDKELKVMRKENKVLEAARLEQRTHFDLEMIRQVGYCTGIENYSRYFDGRHPGDPAYTLIDYFTMKNKEFLMFIDESHITVPQIGGMYEGDRSRKNMLVQYGFRMKSAYDNRPLKFSEFEKKIQQAIFVSATPGRYEITKSQKHEITKTRITPPVIASERSERGNPIVTRDKSRLLRRQSPSRNDSGEKLELQASGVVEQLIRPTGLLEPEIEVRKTDHQIDDLMKEIEKRVQKKQRVLVTTLTKRMSEDLAGFMQEKGMKVAYLHSEVDTFDRIDIIQKLREGFYDCLVGINLLREGLDLPEVSLVAILDADKEGFLRSITSFLQIMGRAARHVEGRVIMYADKMTDSMKYAIAEVERRRKIQIEYNKKHGITPTTIIKNIKKGILSQVNKVDEDAEKRKEWLKHLDPMEAEHVIAELRQQMEFASKNWEFEKATKLRDEISALTNRFFPTRTKSKFGNIKRAARGE